LQVSAEESWRTPAIIDASIELHKDDVPIVTTVQANLRRSLSDINRLADAGVPVRLVKAYVEPSGVAHRWGVETDTAYARIAHRLRDAGAETALAPHDPVLREALLPAFDHVTIEMLLGVRMNDALDLVSRGETVRIYVPFGDDWFRYWMRRRVESLGV
jgi:proline dehydrogenase